MSFKCADGNLYSNINGWRYEWQLPALQEGIPLMRHDADRIVAGLKNQGVKLLALGFVSIVELFLLLPNRNRQILPAG